ncbi:hypothetical protein QCA50_015352 [Cerrena zonata]|uniref:Alpha-1,3-glucosyltransferase n=1 Tax=Cerrena zonata TaxID=2478898 RepID=A0AAW0FRD6_9APHY
MDEFPSTTLGESSTIRQRVHSRNRSFISQSSTQSVSQATKLPPRLRTPSIQHRTSTDSLRSNVTNSDILSPIPRRHHHLQAHESRHWLSTPPLSPVSTRADSPLSARGLSPRALRQGHTLSFSSLTGPDTARLRASQTHVTHEKKTDDGMARRWVRWMHKHNIKQWVLPCAILAVTLVKWCIGLGSYSGKGNPPMYGDYEAQRHWMELTFHLPVTQWYTYDLEYWGLDYPPLTAYVSWLCGFIGNRINPSWVALDKSRGIESTESQIFMRSTVLFFDALIYIPAIVLFTRIWQQSRSHRTQHVALLTLLFQPALLLIDFGHFQYNSVMLGFSLLALNFFAAGQDVLGAICFSLSLGFKQMALYYAPAIGTYLIAKCIYLGPQQGRSLFIRLALATSLTFLILFLPFLLPFAPISAILHPITRIFPFARGLFEDKVANFWCATNVIFKWKIWFSKDHLVKLSTLLTAAGFLPSVIVLIYAAWKLRVQASEDKSQNKDSGASSQLIPLLPYALLNASLSFYLFSFQVHEKTILVPLLPLTLLLAGSSHGSETFELGVLVNNVAVFSMWPLLQRDGQAIPYIALTLLWNRLIGYNPLRPNKQIFLRYLSLAIYTAIITLHALELLIPPPTHLPDLYPVLNVLISTPVFALTWLWSIKREVEVSWALGGLGPSSASSTKSAPLPTSSSSVRPGLPDRKLTSDRLGVNGLDGVPEDSALTSSVESVASRQVKSRSLGFARGSKVLQRTASAGPPSA